MKWYETHALPLLPVFHPQGSTSLPPLLSQGWAQGKLQAIEQQDAEGTPCFS